MPSPLTQRALDAFPPEIRRRGRSYFLQDRVTIADRSGHGLWAIVRGSGTSYEVDVDWSRAADGWLGVACTCPYFTGSLSPCKHLWATLESIDAKNEFRRIRGTQKMQLFLIEGLEEDDLGAGLTPPSRWRQWLETLERRAPREESQQTRREVYFLVDRDQGFITDGYVRVHFYRRDELRSGGLGKLKASPTSESELELFDDDDRRVMRLMLGLGGSDWDGLAGSPYDYDPRRRSVAIEPPLFDMVLPMLCRTGRFGWLPDGKEDFRPLAYDVTPPWRFEMSGESEGERLYVRGAYVRETVGDDGEAVLERRALDEPIVIFATGEIFFRRSIGRLAHARSHFPWAATLRQDPNLYIPHEEVPAALDAMAELPGQPPFELPESFDWPTVVLDPEPILQVSFDDDGEVVGRAVFAYGDRRVGADDARGSWRQVSEQRIIRRHHPKEAGFLAQLEAYGGDGDGFEVAIADFPGAARHLQEQGWRLEADGKSLRPSGGFAAGVSSRRSSGVDWFELDGSMQFDDVQVALPELLRAAGRGERFITLGDGSLGLLPEQWLERFAPLSKLLSGKDGLRFEGHQALLLDALLAAQPDVDLQVDEAFARISEKLRAFDGLEPAEAPAGFCGELRPYQELGLAWMDWLAELGLGGCLADDMGLGKTIQVLALFENRRVDAERPSLLVVPRSLLHNWQSEAERFTPELVLHPHHGPGRAARLRDVLDRHRAPVLVTTYGTLRRDIGRLGDLDFEFAVLDEAQAIKNASSQTAKACRLVRARHRLALTGTPVENHLGELWSLFEFLNPGMLGSLPSTASLAGRQQLPPESLEILARAIRPLVLRRTKTQVLKDLPTKTEQTLHCELSKKEQSRYDELLAHYRAHLGQKMKSVGLGRSKVMVLEALLRLRQAACHGGLIDHELENTSSAKIDLLLERLDELVQEGHKALVFSQFTRLLAIVRRQLEARGLVYEYLDGRTRDRQAKVERFQEDAQCPLFLISLKAGGVGLNLTAASYVFLLDPWWNPAVEMQAIDRVHRIGQEQPVFAYRLIARGTVEEKILELQAEKKALADAIVAQDQRFFAKLTAEDLELLLGGSLG